ncbi:carbohydrate ABC transporter permease [Nonomuraea spiralis]|uniref:Carbohydrate ABC transporter permease n=1 Tax=Nonomuraea spiralis TaxID=46182 RepID=A0ABV5IX08_9ACTN|nr:carbohydrate ABC transporter permease [Nonomuraea spiralis]GGS82578.1 sugar ABC transporter permease [Nonomuraea spiralis]
MAVDVRPAVRRRAASPVRREPRLRRSMHLVLGLWAVLVVVPMAWTLLASFKDTAEIFGPAWTLPARLRFDNWVRAFEQAHIGTYLVNTVIVVVLSTAGTMMLGSMAAYVLARYPFRGSGAVYLLFVSGMAFPVYLALTPLFFVVRNSGSLPLIGPLIGLDTRGGLVLVYIAYSLPFTVFFLTAFFRTLPGSVAEAAFMDGASHTRVFFQVMLPMARPALTGITVFNVLGQWNQYQLPLILLSGNARDKWVLTQGIADISTATGYSADWGALFAALSMSILPMLAVYVAFHRHIQAGMTEGAVK